MRLNWLGLSLIVSVFVTTHGFLQFELVRIPHRTKKFNPIKSDCPDATKLNKYAEYRYVCYYKDISYAIKFYKYGLLYYLSMDLTTPISWIKDQKCHLSTIGGKCTRVYQHTIHDKIEVIKHKLKHKKDDGDDDSEEEISVEAAVIYGSTELVKGKLTITKNLVLYTRDSRRLTSFLEVLMLGLYFLGETDKLSLYSTNFIEATYISPNLNQLCDGAISLRFDYTSYKSFLNEIFTYLRTTYKIVTIYLGVNNTITIGAFDSAEYSYTGYAGIVWVGLTDDETYGKLASITTMSLLSSDQSTRQYLSVYIFAIFTLSASYIGMPAKYIEYLSKRIGKLAKCSVNNNTDYYYCIFENKKNIKKLLYKHLYFIFDNSAISFSFYKLHIETKSKKVIFNIKRTPTEHIILGYPAFKYYYILFDYGRDRIGHATPRKHFNQGWINVVTLVHFLMLVLVSGTHQDYTGTSFLLCYAPCRKMISVFRNRSYMAKPRGSERQKLRQYSPLQENPYDYLKGKIQEVIGSSYGPEGI